MTITHVIPQTLFSTWISSLFLTFSESCIKIQVKPANSEYTILKDLICRQSAYFDAMFKYNFKEGNEQVAILEEIEGVISTQSVEALLHWLSTHKINQLTSMQRLPEIKFQP